jgi:peptidoglycan hydrolase CwlO-like protein
MAGDLTNLKLADIVWNAFLGLLALSMGFSTWWAKATSKRQRESELAIVKLEGKLDKEVAIIKSDISHMRREIGETKTTVNSINSKVDQIQGSITQLSNLVITHIREDK